MNTDILVSMNEAASFFIQTEPDLSLAVIFNLPFDGLGHIVLCHLVSSHREAFLIPNPIHFFRDGPQS